MAELTVSQLNKILSTTEENIQKKYDNLASLYTAQSTQLEVELVCLIHACLCFIILV